MIAVVEDLFFWWQSVLLTCDSKGVLKFGIFSRLSLHITAMYLGWFIRHFACLCYSWFLGENNHGGTAGGKCVATTKIHCLFDDTKTTFLPPQFTAWLRGISTVSLWLFDKSSYCNLFQTVWQHRKNRATNPRAFLHCLGTWPYNPGNPKCISVRSQTQVFGWWQIRRNPRDNECYESCVWNFFFKPTSTMSKLETKKTSFLLGDLEVPWFMTNPQSDLNHRFLWWLFCSVPKKVNQLIVNSTMPCPAPQNISGFKQFNIDAWFRGGRCRKEDKRRVEISLTSAQPSWGHTEKQCAPYVLLSTP